MFRRKSYVNHEPAVVVPDRELALMAALSEVFPGAKHLLCVWHINKKILAKCMKHFVGIGSDEDKAWDSFISSWSECTEATTVDDYEASWLRCMHPYWIVSPQYLA
jgi:transposase-like protein